MWSATETKELCNYLTLDLWLGNYGPEFNETGVAWNEMYETPLIPDSIQVDAKGST